MNSLSFSQLEKRPLTAHSSLRSPSAKSELRIRVLPWYFSCARYVASYFSAETFVMSRRKGIFLLCLAAIFAGSGLSAAGNDGLDDLDVGLEFDATDKAGVRKIADQMLKDPASINVEKAIQVIGHPALGDIDKASSLYEAVKTRVKPEHAATLSRLLKVDDSFLQVSEQKPGAQGAALDSPTTGLLVRLLGRTRNPEAKDILLRFFKGNDMILKGAAAEGIGLLGDKSQLPLLQQEFGRLGNQKSSDSAYDFSDSLLLGMLYLGDFRYLSPLISKTASTSHAISGAILTIASGYTPPDIKEKMQKQLKTLRPRFKALKAHIVEIGPLFPKEMADVIIKATDPNVCDVLYRLLPSMMTKERVADFIPALRCANMDMRQLMLDILAASGPNPEEMKEIRRAVMEWYGGKDAMGRAWAVRNCRILEEPERHKILFETLKRGTRWEQIEAVIEIGRCPDSELIEALNALSKETSDPDVQFHLARTLAGAK